MAMIAIDRQEIVTRQIAVEDADAVAELSGQLGYETSAPKVRERIVHLLTLAGDRVALFACV